jgi:hypothetical protein
VPTTLNDNDSNDKVYDVMTLEPNKELVWVLPLSDSTIFGVIITPQHPALLLSFSNISAMLNS